MYVRGAYWRYFKRDQAAGLWPTKRWFFNPEGKLRVTRGDFLVLFASGEAVGADDDDSHKGYIVQMMVVGSVQPNPDDDSDYPKSQFAQVVLADPDQNYVFNPPKEADGIVRKASSDPSLPIGIARQAPFSFGYDDLAMLQRIIPEMKKVRFDF